MVDSNREPGGGGHRNKATGGRRDRDKNCGGGECASGTHRGRGDGN